MAKTQLPEEIRAFFVSQGSKGGKVGGPKRMEGLSAEGRTALAKKAVAAREAKRARTAKIVPARKKLAKKSAYRTQTS